MEKFNYSLYLLINAPAHAAAAQLAFAKMFAEYLIWLAPAMIGIGWLRGDECARRIMLQAAASGLIGLLINQAISLVWLHPRPFMIGLGHTYLAHAADSSFPSDHLTLLWAVSFSLLMHRRLRAVALALSLLGLPVAWARIYLGVHFPLDMVGAVLVAGASARLAFHGASIYLLPAYRVAIHLHRALFGTFIQRGWIRE